MAEKNSTQTLVDEKLALSLFLDSLMREPAEEVAEEVVSEVATETRIINEVKPVVTEAVTPVEARIEVEPETDISVDTELKTGTLTETEAVQQTHESDRAENFQAMLFKVAGLTLAVPLDELSGVVEFQDDLTIMPGRSDFYMGLLQYLDKTVPVVDTARLVLPHEKRIQLAGDDPNKRVKRIVLINDSRWGLACDEVEEVISLNKDDVHWRSSRTKRKWLLGTIKEHMCALIDTDAFAEKLEQGSE